jgi:hypothetical protein
VVRNLHRVGAAPDQWTPVLADAELADEGTP